MPVEITEAMFTHRWPHAAHSLIEGIVATAPTVLPKYGIDTAQDAADFLAECSEETGGATAMEENLNYTAERMVEVWPSRFRTIAAAAPFSHNPRLLADCVYGGRLGNRPGSDDGWNFRGRGLIEITGADWYKKLATLTGVPIVDNPNLVNDPQHALEIAAAYWKDAGVSALANAGNFVGEVIRINGAKTNLDLRLAWRHAWRPEFGLPAN